MKFTWERARETLEKIGDPAEIAGRTPLKQRNRLLPDELLFDRMDASKVLFHRETLFACLATEQAPLRYFRRL